MNDPALRFTRRLERIVGSEQPSLETARGDVRWDDLYDARRRSLQEQIDAERCECPVCRRLS